METSTIPTSRGVSADVREDVVDMERTAKDALAILQKHSKVAVLLPIMMKNLTKVKECTPFLEQQLKLNDKGLTDISASIERLKMTYEQAKADGNAKTQNNTR